MKVSHPFQEPKDSLPDNAIALLFTYQLGEMAADIRSDFTFDLAKAQLPLAGLGQGDQEHEYDLSASAFSFSSGCLTPPDSNSTVSSRRPSEALFDPYSSSPKTPPSNTISFQHPGLDGQQSSDLPAINPPTALQPFTRQEGPIAFGQSSFEQRISNIPYACGASAASGRESLDYGNLEENELLDTTELPRKQGCGWQYLGIHGEPDPIILGTSENFIHGQEHVYEPFLYSPGNFPSVSFIDPNTSPSAQAILPSQTLVYPNTPFPSLATPFESKNETAGGLSSHDYPASPEAHKIDSYYQSDRKVLAVVVKPSKASHTALHPSARKSSSRLKPNGSRKHSSSDRDSDQWDSYEIKTLKAECTTVESHKSKKYLCEICPQGFDRQEHWKRHEKTTMHREKLKKMDKARLGPDPPMYYCRVCQKGLNRHDNVKPHEESHLPSNGKTRRHSPIPVERSLELGMGDMDPRINPDLKKKTRKKARLH